MKRILAAVLCCALMLACFGSALAFEYEKDYFKSDHNKKIAQIQQRLIDLGYLNDVADGWLGNKTQAAIIRFQLVHGMEQTGIADQAMQEALFSDDAKESPPVLMSLGEFKELMGARTKLVRYDMSLMEVGRDSATMVMNNDTTLHLSLMGDGVTKIQMIGKGNVKVPFTILLMALDNGIDDATMFDALDQMIEEGTRILGSMVVEYGKDEDGTERLTVRPVGGAQD